MFENLTQGELFILHLILCRSQKTLDTEWRIAREKSGDAFNEWGKIADEIYDISTDVYEENLKVRPMATRAEFITISRLQDTPIFALAYSLR